MQVQVNGEWTTTTSGGCPKFETWHINPQYQLVPSIAAGASATYTLTLRQRAASQYEPIGLWVLQAGDATSRKKDMSKLDMCGKSKFKASEQQVLQLNLIAREGGLPYIVCCSFFEPGLTSSFTLTLHAPEDPGAQLIPLQPVCTGPTAQPQPTAAVPPPLRATAPPSSLLRAAPVARAAPAPTPAMVAAPVAPLAPPASIAPAAVAAAAPVTPVEFDGEPTLRVEGQGLSEKQQADAARMISAALATIPAGHLFQDAEFPVTAASLGPGAHASRVASWRRPVQIAGADARLWKNDWEIEGIVCGPVANGSLLGAANILAGDRDVIAKVFVSTEHGARGLYALRFWQDDPNSDDDLKVVLIDDRLPCGPDGALAFTRSPDRGVFWAALLEKALAKLHGSYAATEAPQTQEAALLGLELLSGGKAREQPMPLRGGPAEEVWAALQEASRTAHVMGARLDPAAPGAAAAAALGLHPDRAYCVVTCGEMPCGRMLRLRGFVGDSEWKGKWSDRDAAWTSRLRQLLNYRDASDGTFWIEFADFCAHFTDLYLVRMADDRWTRLSMRARWADDTAGGPPSLQSWRCNPQWLLTVRKPDTRVLVELTLPATSLAAPIGLLILRGGQGVDRQRRKLWLADGDLLDHAEPRVGRRNSIELLLPPADVPYVLVPYCATPGFESPFLLTVLSDDTDDDGKPDFGLEPLRAATDWHVLRSVAPWDRAAAPPGSAGFRHGLQLNFSLGGDRSAAPKGRVFAFVDTIGVTSNMRTQQGMQAAPQYPAIGMGLAPAAGGPTPLADLPADAHVQSPVARDGISFGANLECGSSHVLAPFLAEDEAAALAARGGGMPQMVVTLYSELPIRLADAFDESEGAPDCLDPCGCDKCTAGGKRRPSPYMHVLSKMERLEAIMDHRIAFLNMALGAH
jgi:hypothetical protein